jgi:hypothetical protein
MNIVRNPRWDGRCGILRFKLKQSPMDLIFIRKIKGLLWPGVNTLFQYEKPGHDRTERDQFLFSRSYFFIFRHNVVRGRLSILALRFLLKLVLSRTLAI